MNAGNKGKRQLALAKGETRHLLKEGGNMVGRRDPNKQAALEVTLDDPTVSKQHARVEVSGEAVTVVPFDTPNKSKLNKKNLVAKERYTVSLGDELVFGKDGPYKLVDVNAAEAGPLPDSGKIAMPVVFDAKKKINDEKISLTNPDAKYWVERKIRERVNEETILQRHGEQMKENDMKKTRLEDLNARRVALEEQLKIMKSKSSALDAEIERTKESKRTAAEEYLKKKDHSGQANGFQKAFESFASEIQRKINSLQSTNNEKTQMLKEMNKREFIKQYEKEGSQVLELREKFMAINREIEAFKEKLKILPQRLGDGAHFNTDHISSLIEQQYEELSVAKKQIIEYDARETINQQQWNSLLSENIQKEERVKGLKLQIERNLDNLQVLMMDHDSQMFELCKKVFEAVGLYGNEQQKEAAYFLIEQLPLIQEERREIVLENEQFHLSNQETIHEIERVKGDIDRLKGCVDGGIDLESAGQTELLEYLKARLDRLHERVEAEKGQERVSRLSDLRAQIERAEAALHRETHRKSQLRLQLLELLKHKPFTDKQSLVGFFSSLIEGKDEHLAKLAKHLELLHQKKKEQHMHLLQLREMVAKGNAQYEDLRAKQRNFSTAIFEKETHDIYINK